MLSVRFPWMKKNVKMEMKGSDMTLTMGAIDLTNALRQVMSLLPQLPSLPPLPTLKVEVEPVPQPVSMGPENLFQFLLALVPSIPLPMLPALPKIKISFGPHIENESVQAESEAGETRQMPPKMSPMEFACLLLGDVKQKFLQKFIHPWTTTTTGSPMTMMNITTAMNATTTMSPVLATMPYGYESYYHYGGPKFLPPTQHYSSHYYTPVHKMEIPPQFIPFPTQEWNLGSRPKPGYYEREAQYKNNGLDNSMTMMGGDSSSGFATESPSPTTTDDMGLNQNRDPNSYFDYYYVPWENEGYQGGKMSPILSMGRSPSVTEVNNNLSASEPSQPIMMNQEVYNNQQAQNGYYWKYNGNNGLATAGSSVKKVIKISKEKNNDTDISFRSEQLKKAKNGSSDEHFYDYDYETDLDLEANAGNKIIRSNETNDRIKSQEKAIVAKDKVVNKRSIRNSHAPGEIQMLEHIITSLASFLL